VKVGLSADSGKMEKEQYRSVIRFLFLEGKSHNKIKERLDAVYGNSSPSMATVKNWFNEFQRGRTCSEEGEDCLISSKGDGHRFLGFTRSDPRRLLGGGQNDHKTLLRRIITPICIKNGGIIGEKEVLFHHDIAPAHITAVVMKSWN